ncbi:MAG: hypothetical protein JNL01_14520 [Bdellovibrionales bacterium]|nr:hypothetical protein [Bdellovibrionales bacterium]
MTQKNRTTWILANAVSVALSVASSTAFAAGSYSSATLIREVDGLRNSLPMKDPGRAQLTLRLADLYFDYQAELFRDAGGDPSDTKVRRARQDAVRMYEEALSGNNGMMPKPSYAVETKIKFQLGRLHSDLGQTDKAMTIFKELAQKADFPELQRESLLRMAENAESSGRFEEAAKLFGTVAQICSGGDVCVYTRYRMAWAKNRGGDVAGAITEMKTALYDSKGQIREESLRDLVQFMGSAPAQAQEEMVWLEQFAGKHHRMSLMDDLAASYFSAGNKTQGTQVLELLYSRKPTLAKRVKLMEENYGVRKWDRFVSLLEDTVGGELPSGPDAAKETAEIEGVLRRLSVQLDAERKTQADKIPMFLKTVDFYLGLFPKSTIRSQMIDGWIAAETNQEKKIARLALWINDSNTQGKELIRLREMRASIAQKAKNHAIIAEEMSALALIAATPAKKREYQYLAARAQYELKNLDQAMPTFEALSDRNSFGNEPDQWAIQSKNLVLDILNQKKDFAKILASAEQWTNDPILKRNAKLRDELADIQKIADQAKFELAGINRGVEGLKTFMDFCKTGQFTPKSCENAKILSIETKSQGDLIAVLEKQGNETDLAAEYEASGYFLKAAKLQEKLLAGKDWTLKNALRVALLYELGGDMRESRRIVESLTSSKGASITKNWSEQEQLLVYHTLRDQKMLNAGSLNMAWTTKNRLMLAEELEEKGQGSKLTKEVILSAAETSGPAWARYVLEEGRALDAEQRKIGFYGKNGQKKFDQRLKAIAALNKYAEKRLPGSDAKTRVELAGICTEAYQGLSDEILNSPIPQGLPEEAVVQIKASLDQMALPFVDQTGKYRQVVMAEWAKVTDEKDRQDLLKRVSKLAAWTGSASGNDLVVTSQASAQPTAIAKATHSVSDQGILGMATSNAGGTNAQIERLHSNPQDRDALQALKEYYASKQQPRLSAYFEGRLRDLK